MGNIFGGYDPTGTQDPTGGGGTTPPTISQPRPTSGTGGEVAPLPGTDGTEAPTTTTTEAPAEGAPTFVGSAGGGGLSLEEDEDKRRRIKRRTLGTQQLQIPLTSTGVSTGASVNTGLNI